MHAKLAIAQAIAQHIVHLTPLRTSHRSVWRRLTRS